MGTCKVVSLIKFYPTLSEDLYDATWPQNNSHNTVANTTLPPELKRPL